MPVRRTVSQSASDWTCRGIADRVSSRIRTQLQGRVRPTLPILPFDAAAAGWQARERACLSRNGRAPPYADAQIAAIAAVNCLVLAKRNVQDSAGLADLTVVNWLGRSAEAET
jgi:tRNA(fMet)-specific endonuclease VapC